MRDVLAAAVAALYLTACGGPIRPVEQSNEPAVHNELCTQMWAQEFSGPSFRAGNTILYLEPGADIDSGDRQECIYDAVIHPDRNSPFMEAMVRLYEQLVTRDGSTQQEARGTVLHLIQNYVRQLAEYAPDHMSRRAQLGQRHMEIFDRRIGYEGPPGER